MKPELNDHRFWNSLGYLPTTLEEYHEIEQAMNQMSQREVFNWYWLLARADLYFLLRYVLSTREFFHEKFGLMTPQWILDRCREVQADSHKVVDIWARFHWKSLIKTFANIIRYILIDPDTTILILSHTRPNAKKFLSQVVREITGNELLRRLSYDFRLEGQIFPDSEKEFKRLSLDEGVIVNRLSNPKEGTLEAAGLVDSLPQGPHFMVRAIDDAVTPASVNTPDMKEKTLSMWELSQPLGMPGGGGEEWITGTFYAADDLFHDMMKRGYKLRLHPCYEVDWDNTAKDEKGLITKLAHHTDKPVLYRIERLQEMIRDMGAEEGSRNAAMQMFCDPAAGTMSGFDAEWLNYYERDAKAEGRGKNIYILVDPANEKKERLWKSSYTSMWVVGLGEDGNYYMLDGVCDRLNLSERADALFRLHRKWSPIEVRYEKFGMQADIEHIQYVMGQTGYRFKIIPVKGLTSKKDRISRLEPLFKAGRFFLPDEMWRRTVDGEKVNLVELFKEEYNGFPNSSQMDMLDALSRIAEPELRLLWPKQYRPEKYERARYPKRRAAAVSWMAA